MACECMFNVTVLEENKRKGAGVMKSCVILWDNDIGWSEKLQRELFKKEIEVFEPEIFSFPAFFDEKESEIFNGEWKKLSGKGDIQAVVISTAQLIEWKEQTLDSTEKLSEESDEENPELWLAKCMQRICRLIMVPVILITEKSCEDEEILAFESGVCDYIERKKEIRICTGRILACLKKKVFGADTAKGMNKVYLNEQKQSICFSGKEILLTEKEYQVFCVLWEKKGEPVSQKELLEIVWSGKQVKCQRVADTLIKQLRHKLKDAPFAIKNKYGTGYYITANGSPN